MEQFWNLLDEPDRSLLYRRGEAGDPRYGETVSTDRNKFDSGFAAVIIGFPYDEGTVRNKGRAGSSFGPDEIRRAFYKLTPTKSFALKDGVTKLFDAGNVKREMRLEDALAHLESVVTHMLKSGLVPVVLGGSNDLSYPDFRACKKSLGRCGAINIDSHLDMRDYSDGINSGTPYRMLIDERSLNGRDFVEYGIQEFANSRDHLAYAREAGVQVYTITQIHAQKNNEAFMAAYRVVSAEAEGVYVSIDIDSVRACDAPGVSAPSPSGLTVDEILECAYLAGTEEKTKMIDVCEFNPKYDIDAHTAKLAAMIVSNFLAGLSNRQ